LPEAVPSSQIEPAPAVDDIRPADIRMPQPAPPAEAAAAADLGGAPEAPADGSSAQQQAAVAGGIREQRNLFNYFLGRSITFAADSRPSRFLPRR
jgi:hypothetical protein